MFMVLFVYRLSEQLEDMYKPGTFQSLALQLL